MGVELLLGPLSFGGLFCRQLSQHLLVERVSVDVRFIDGLLAAIDRVVRRTQPGQLVVDGLLNLFVAGLSTVALGDLLELGVVGEFVEQNQEATAREVGSAGLGVDR